MSFSVLNIRLGDPMQQQLEATIIEIVKAAKTGDGTTLRHCFADLTQIQAVFVAAKASAGLQNTARGGNLIADGMITDFAMTNVAGAITFCQKIDNGKLDDVLRQLSCEVRSEAVAYVSMICERRPGIAQRIADRCLAIVESEQIEEVFG